LDKSWTNRDISILLGADQAKVDYVIAHRNAIAPLIVTVLNVLYPDESITTPYRNK